MFKAKQVATSVSGHSVIVKRVVLPVEDPDEVASSIEFDADQYIPFEIAEVNLDYEVIGPSQKEDGGLEVLLVAAKKDQIENNTSVVTMAGRTAQAVDVDAFALQNAFEVNYNPDPNDTIALLNIGASLTNINITKAGMPLFIRDVSVGGSQCTDRSRVRFGTLEEAENVDAEAFEEPSFDTGEMLAEASDTEDFERVQALADTFWDPDVPDGTTAPLGAEWIEERAFEENGEVAPKPDSDDSAIELAVEIARENLTAGFPPEENFVETVGLAAVRSPDGGLIEAEELEPAILVAATEFPASEESVAVTELAQPEPASVAPILEAAAPVAPRPPPAIAVAAVPPPPRRRLFWDKRWSLHSYRSTRVRSLDSTSETLI